MKSKKTLLYAGGTGSAIAAICCFTPVLAVVLPLLGLGAWLAWADFVLLPALAIFLAITVYAAIALRRERRACGAPAVGQAGERQP